METSLGIPLYAALLWTSAINIFIALWLGLTVLLNAERRSWGMWLAGSGMLLTGLLFITHLSALYGSIQEIFDRLVLYWYAVCIPATLLPLIWYAAMLWFAGYWESTTGGLRGRHRIPLASVAALSLFLLAVGCIFAAGGGIPGYLGFNPLPWGLHLNVALFGVYTLLCFGLAIDALRHLEPSGRIMGDLARRRARRWLVAVSIMQLVVGATVTGGMFLGLELVIRRNLPIDRPNLLEISGWADLAVSILVGLSLLLVGNAIVSYEIFTGKILPRSGLRRHWQRTLILAIVGGACITGALLLQIPRFFVLLGTTVAVALFYALLNWRSYVERDRYLESLRPFVGSQGLFEGIVEMAGDSEGRDQIAPLFRSLCVDVLGTRRAALVPLGMMSSLGGPIISWPDLPAANLADPQRTELRELAEGSRDLCLSLDPLRFDGAVWGIPLWSGRGLIGALLLGEKRDGGLYTQEEMELARASSERLLDSRAGSEMARRLMELERRRLAERRVIDGAARRSLHDDILPQIHSLMLSLDSVDVRNAPLVDGLASLHRDVSDLLRSMPPPGSRTLDSVGLVEALRGVVEGEHRNTFDAVVWEIEPDAEHACTDISPLTREVLFYAAREAIRNAAHYGRGGDATRRLQLVMRIRMEDGRLLVDIEDDGVGVEPGIRRDGGSGEGLALHETMMAVIGGSLDLESLRGVFTRVRLTVGVGRG